MEETDMKILYLSNTTTRYWPTLHKGFPSVDYVADGLLHGLKSKHSSDVTDVPYKPYMYKSSDINKLDLYGRGFTITKTLDDDESDRNNIEEKIKSKFFDCVIYGSIHRNRDYFDLVTQVYNKDKIALIDGEDDTFLDYSLIDKGVYFKRELLDDSKKLFPISLAFPLEKIQNTNKNKTQAISKNLPSAGGDTWIWTDENDYYSDYNKSFFGHTWKKGGWESYRHYEIIFSYCYPLFKSLESCPPRCLTTLPKEDLINIMKHVDREYKVDESFYYEQMDKLFSYAQKHLTTTALANYVLEQIT